MWNEATVFNFKLQLHYLLQALSNPSKTYKFSTFSVNDNYAYHQPYV